MPSLAAPQDLASLAAEAIGTPMVGRHTELLALQAAFQRLADGRQAAAVTLLAEPGIGKHRLLRDFHACAQARPAPFHVLRRRATPQTEGQPFGLLGGLLRSFCQIDPDGSAQAARARFEQAIVPCFLADDGADLAQCHVHLLGHLLGIDFADSPHVQGLLATPQQLRQMAINAATQWLRRLGATGSAPVLLQIDDLHWADSETLDFLDHLLQSHPDLALLIVATARPALADRRPAWVRGEGVHTRLALGPLADAGARVLATGLLRRLPEVPQALLARVVGGAQGNPFCIEERIRLLIDKGVICTRNSAWTVSAARLRVARLPATLAGVLAARLKLLPAAELRVLQQASVIGPVFLHGALRALGAGAARAMAGLMQRELMLAHGGARGAGAAASGGTAMFSFKHQLLQQVAYDSTPRLTRRALHGKLARWLGALSGLQASDAPGQAAFHFEQAGHDARAAAQHTLAAEQACARFAVQAVLAHVQAGLALLGRLPATPQHRDMRWRLLSARVALIESGGRRTEQAADLDSLSALAEEADDDRQRAQVWASRWHFCLLSNDMATMNAAARQRMACGVRLGDEGVRLDAMRMLVIAHLQQADYDAAQRLVTQCLAQAQARGLQRIEASCMNLLAVLAQTKLDPVATLEWHEKDLALRRQIGDWRGQALSLCNVGSAWLSLGEPVRARRCCEEALRLVRALGNRLGECGTLCALSELERWLGNGPQALAHAQQALAAAVAIGMPRWEALAMQRLGDAQLLLGQPAAAALTFEKKLAMDLHRDSVLGGSLAGLARSAQACGDLPLAMQHVERLLALDASTNDVNRNAAPRRVELVCHLVLSSAGDPRADTWLRRAHGGLMELAANISDESLREGYLNNIPDHRAILAAWALHEQERAG